MAEHDILVRYATTEQRVRRVSFPVYAKRDIGDGAYATYTRWGFDGRLVTVKTEKEDSGATTFSIQVEHAPWPRYDDNSEWVLGQGEYASTHQEFFAAFTCAQAAILAFANEDGPNSQGR